jgi:hypothetical protein
MFVKRKFMKLCKGHITGQEEKHSICSGRELGSGSKMSLFIFAFCASADSRHLNQPGDGNRLLTNIADPEVSVIDLP